MASQTPTIVALDASVLINFIRIGRIELLGNLPAMTFMVPNEVENEITDGTQAAALKEATAAGHLQQTAMTDPAELEHHVTLTRYLGKGEAACLTLAKTRGWSLASDEKRLFWRTAIAEIGETRILTTPDLIVHAIRADLASVEEADRWKRLLAERRFRMKFDSFAELL